jgi:hypothetical protein
LPAPDARLLDRAAEELPGLALAEAGELALSRFRRGPAAGASPTARR